jgi:WD40 repeat protein/DNA-binding SARP family transcriptional activator
MGPTRGYGRRMEFRVLGSIEVIEEGKGSIVLGGPKQRLVLAHLLLRANHLVPADVLIDEVWGEEPPDTARNALQTYASHLRKALGAERLQGSRAGYRLRADPSELDAFRFESLLRDARRLIPLDAQAAVSAFDHATDLCRGPAFADLATEPSLRAEAARFEDLRLGALEDRIETQLSMGRHAEVVGELERLVARNPLRERFWEQLLLALYRSGRQGEALAAYQRARKILADELGMDPSPKLRQVHERILAQSPDLDLRGEPLRGYRLLERIGEDTVGALYRATQPNAGREVVVRIVHEDRANDPTFVRRFESDAQAVAALESPHIAPVYDYWREPGRAYVVTRFLRGSTLRELLDGSVALSPERESRILEQIASAMASAHRRGVSHGNLGASSVLVDEEGNAYVTNFAMGDGSIRPEDDAPAFVALVREALGERVPMPVADALRRAETQGGIDDVAAYFAELTSALSTSVDVTTPIAAGVRNPYKGLRPFLETDAHDFFGREAFISHLLERMSHPESARFVAVVGPSGSGKSSVVRAGLVPALRQGAVAGSERWFVTEMHPGHHPLEELDAALMRVAVRPPAGMLARLEAGPRGLVEVAGAIVPEGTELVLVLDQLEEVFTLTESEDDRSLLLESLRVAAADPQSRVRIVATLRADFYDRPLSYPRIGHLLASTTEVLSPLTPEELERAIMSPAQRAGLTIDSALVPQIASDVAEQPGVLPLVQYALTELYDRREGGRLTLDAYLEIGGVGGALAASAEHLYASRPAPSREAVRQLFLRLVTLGEGAADTRRRVRLSELSALEVDTDAIESALDAYGRHRLVTFDRDPATREPTVEVAHEALLGAWERLSSWIDEAREDVRTRRRLSDAAREWESSGQEPSFLLAGSRLDQFEAWGSGTSLALGREERAYLTASGTRSEEERVKDASRRARERLLERRSLKRLRAFVAVFAAAALVAGSLTVFARSQRARAERESKIATARELAAASGASIDDDVDQSLLLAIQAVDTTFEADGTVLPEAEQSLHLAVQADRLLRTFPGYSSVHFSPDDNQLLTAGSEPGTAHVFDVESGEEVLTILGHGDGVLANTAYSPDGATIATASYPDRTTKLWDSQTGAPRMTFADPAGNFVCCSAEFSPDGSVLQTWAYSSDESCCQNRFYSVRSGEELRRLRLDWSGMPSFSPDGKRLALGRCVIRWKLPDATEGQVCTPEHPDAPASAASWSPDGSLVATSFWDGTTTVWDPRSGQELTTLSPGAPGFALDVEFSPIGSRLAMGFTDGTVRVWDLTGATATEALVLPGHSEAVDNVAFSHDGTKLASASTNTVKVWDVTVQGGDEGVSVPGSGGFAYTPNGQRIAIGHGDDSVRLYDAVTGEVSHVFTASGRVLIATLDRSGTRLAAGTSGGSIWVWDVETGDEMLRLEGHEGGDVLDVAFSPDGQLLGSTSGEGRIGSTEIWDASSGALVDAFEGGGQALAFTPDGARLAVTSAGVPAKLQQRILIWDVETGASVRTLNNHLQVNAVAISPDGKQIIAGGLDGGLREWDLESGRFLGTMEGNLSQIWSIGFSPDGKLLATSSDDGTVRLWDPIGRRQLATVAREDLTAGFDEGFDVGFSPDGTRLAATAADGRLHVFVLPVDELLRIAQGRLDRGFTEQECRQYLHMERCP